MPKYNIDYKKSIIYKIEHLENPELLYVGSSTNFIKRKQQHKLNCHNETGFHYNIRVYKMIRDNGGWDQFKIIIIKEYPCNNKIELLIEEDRIMKELKASLNSQSAYTSSEDRILQKKELDKQYRINNIEKLKQYDKEYYKDHEKKYKEYREIHKEKHNEYNKQWYENNKEQSKEHSKKQYQNNKEEINKKRLKKIKCECGCEITHCSKSRHIKTKKHLKYINDLNTTEEISQIELPPQLKPKLKKSVSLDSILRK
jgi:hypothetical protein